MYKMGLAVYKQCEQRLTDLNYQELQQKVHLISVHEKNAIQHRYSNVLNGSVVSKFRTSVIVTNTSRFSTTKSCKSLTSLVKVKVILCHYASSYLILYQVSISLEIPTF